LRKEGAIAAGSSSSPLFEGSCGEKKWWSLLKRMEMEISIGAREKHLTLSMVDFLEKRERIR